MLAGSDTWLENPCSSEEKEKMMTIVEDEKRLGFGLEGGESKGEREGIRIFGAAALCLD